MKKKKVYEHVREIISRYGSDRAVLAHLRTGVGRDYFDTPDLIHYTQSEGWILPDDESLVIISHDVLSLFAFRSKRKFSLKHFVERCRDRQSSSHGCRS